MRKPEWVLAKASGIAEGHDVRRLLRGLGLSTVCESARCPNMGECFSESTATLLLLGDSCTRRCRFCAVTQGVPLPPDREEPKAAAEAVRRLGLRYVVLTSVTRDDLPDGGASVFASAIAEIRRENGGVPIEVLIPDFGGSFPALETVLREKPEVMGHNIETVPRLYREVRPGAKYRRSLELLERAARTAPGTITKSGLMLGLGEEKEEVQEVMKDLVEAGCKTLTIGQYLQPTRRHLPVARYLSPGEFSALAKTGKKIGLRQVAAGPLVRSSYQAEKVYRQKALGGEGPVGVSDMTRARGV